MEKLSPESQREIMQAVLDDSELTHDKEDGAIDPRVPEARGMWIRARSALQEAIKRAQTAGLLDASSDRGVPRTTVAAGLLRQWRETRSNVEVGALAVALDRAAVDLDARRVMLEEVLRVAAEVAAAKKRKRNER